MKWIEKCVSWFIKAQMAVSVVFSIIMLAITFMQVVLRYVFNSPTSWAAEVTLLTLVWFCYITMSTQVRLDGHVCIEGLYNKMGPGLQKFCDCLRHVCMTLFAALMIHYGWFMFNLNLPTLLPASRISVGLLYLPLFIGGIFTVIFSLLNLLYVIKPNLKPEDL